VISALMVDQTVLSMVKVILVPEGPAIL